MSELVRFELEEGGAVVVEVDDEAFGVQRAARDEDEVVRAGKKLEAALAVIRPAARAVLDGLGGLAPDEKQVCFGVKLNGQVGALIAKTGAEGHFQVTLTWRASPGGEGS
ncbi:MAG: CU044_2847 family protein [Egibacteraceae bacterium]